MPNLNQILALKEKYSKLNRDEIRTQNYLEAKELRRKVSSLKRKDVLNEAIETKLFSFLNESLNLKEPELIKYFENAKEEDVVLLFIDITSFSRTIQGWGNKKLKYYLDEYYSRVIPIIYSNNGQIEKLMGDGIICVFGPPFINSNDNQYIYSAELCAEEVIKEFHDSDMNVKVAIHKGKINYYKVPGDDYAEYTMIGSPITELFRLESISKPNAINFFDDSPYDKLGFKISIIDPNNIRLYKRPLVSPLSGVDYNNLKYIKFPGFL